MAVSGAKLGYGTLLKRGDGGSPEVFTTIAEVRSITLPTQEREDVDVTHMESPNATREFIAGLADTGEASCRLNFRPDHVSQGAVSGVIDDSENRTLRNYQIMFDQFSGDPTCSFNAYVKSHGGEIVVDDAIQVDVVFKLSAAPTWTGTA